MNVAAFGVAFAVTALGLKYLVLDMIGSETEVMSVFRLPVAAARARIESVEYRERLARLYIEISAQDVPADDEPAPDRLQTLLLRLSGADYVDAIQAIYVAAQLLLKLDTQYTKVRKAGRVSWLIGLAAIVAFIAWAAAVSIEFSSVYAQWVFGGALALLLYSSYRRIRFDLDKRELSQLVNEHS